MKRKYKSVLLHPETVLMCLSGPGGAGDWFNRVIYPDMPVDVTVLSVHYEPAYQSFLVILQHESFPEITEYERIPITEATAEVHRINKVRVFPDLPLVPNPTVRDVAYTRDSSGQYTSRVLEIASDWYATEQVQMKRYGITGWDENNCAIFEPGCGPLFTDSVVVRNPKAIYDELKRTKEIPSKDFDHHGFPIVKPFWKDKDTIETKPYVDSNPPIDMSTMKVGWYTGDLPEPSPPTHALEERKNYQNSKIAEINKAECRINGIYLSNESAGFPEMLKTESLEDPFNKTWRDKEPML